MFNKDIRLNTLYVNNKSKQETYFFYEKNNKLYGARRDSSTNWKWKFGTWISYLKTNEHIEKIRDLENLQRQVIVTFWDYPVEFL